MGIRQGIDNYLLLIFGIFSKFCLWALFPFVCLMLHIRKYSVFIVLFCITVFMKSSALFMLTVQNFCCLFLRHSTVFLRLNSEALVSFPTSLFLSHPNLFCITFEFLLSPFKTKLNIQISQCAFSVTALDLVPKSKKCILKSSDSSLLLLYYTNRQGHTVTEHLPPSNSVIAG